MHIYLKTNPAKFHPDPIWSWALEGLRDFFKRLPQQGEQQRGE